ncbi:MAG: Na+:solute symporter, partial [Chlorobi bacterium]|nr:Na+:solute symporter [Chlorobiota bacterium]
YFALSLGISLYFSKKAGKNTGNFFLSGRNLPWWIAGTSMVATTFAADTPLAVTELVAKHGISGNWLWWNMVIGGILTVFFFARLWRRAHILTDAEFVDIRYHGAPAKFLRGFRAVYIGILMNAIVIAWVNLAMVKILTVMFPDLTFMGMREVDIMGLHLSAQMIYVALMMMFVAFYSSLSGLMGVSVTDSFQFVMAMTGSIALAVYAVRHVGGIDGLKQSLADVKWVFDFFPVTGDEPATAGGEATGLLKLSGLALFTYLGVQWWASWYPGAEPGGGGYIAQRMMSAKDEKHSLFATLWFNIAHYALRPWPWILAALAALVIYPGAEDKGATYVMLIRDLMPSGWIGLMLAAFFAAYMSTLASQTVWGTSYIINDLWRPFVRPGGTEKYYVSVSRVATFVMMLIAFVITTQLNRISDAWKIILIASGGIGAVLILRWYWWRVNAWSEISAMVAPYVLLPFLIGPYGMHWNINDDYEKIFLSVVAWSTLVWLAVTFLTRPTPREKLYTFYRKVHPGGIGWRKIEAELPDVKGDRGYSLLFVNWLAGVLMVLSALFGIGKYLFKEYAEASVFFIIVVITAFVIYRNMQKIGWKKLAG